nr:MAG TPA: hypothetical protein [Caudoviricetes sp.]
MCIKIIFLIITLFLYFKKTKINLKLILLLDKLN